MNGQQCSEAYNAGAWLLTDEIDRMFEHIFAVKSDEELRADKDDPPLTYPEFWRSKIARERELARRV